MCLNDILIQALDKELWEEGDLIKLGLPKPGSVALISDAAVFSNKEFYNRVNKFAAYLQAKGIGANDIVGVYADRTPEMIIGIMAVLKAGAAFLPLDPKYPDERKRFMVSDTGASLILTQEKYGNLLSDYNADIFCLDSEWDSIKQSEKDYKTPVIRQDDLAYVIYTSGSTGTPKGVMVTFGNLAQYTFMAVDEYQMTPDDVALQFGTMNFDVFTEEVFPVYLVGGTLVLRNEASALGGDSFWSFIKKHEISFISLPTAFWQTLCTQLNEKHVEMASSVRLVIFGGEAMSEHMLELWQQKFGSTVRLMNTYGPSETTVVVTGFDCQDFDTSRGKVPIGKPFRNVQCYILDEEMKQCAPGTSGELYIAGPQVAKGYLNRAELTSERFIPNPFSDGAFSILYKTGDICIYLPDGNIDFVGRNDFQIKLRGLRIELGEIETALNRLDPIKESVVILREDTPGDKKIVAYLVPAAENLRLEDIRQALKQVLAGYMIPSAFVPLQKLPLTANGKIDRKSLPVPKRSHMTSEREILQPESALEKKVRDIWEKVLRIEPISCDDDFFEIGGHSLVAVHLFDELRKELGAELPLATLFEAPTIRQLAKSIEKDREELLAASASPLVEINRSGEKVPFYCVHGHFGNVLNFATLSRELGPDQPFYGLQGIGFAGVEDPLTRIEEIAERYVKEIKSVQPSGPYSIGGYCYGTLVAIELANQLRAQGDEIYRLVMFDPQPSLYPELISKEVIERFDKFKAYQRLAINKDELKNKSFLQKFEYFFNRIKDRVVSEFLTIGVKVFDGICRKTNRRLPKVFRDVEFTNFLAMHKYTVAGPWNGAIDLIMSRQVTEGYSDHPDDDWADIATGSVAIHYVDDNGVIAAGEMFKKPYVFKTAEKLKAILRENEKGINHIKSEEKKVKYG